MTLLPDSPPTAPLPTTWCSNASFIQRFKHEGIHMLTPGRFRVNGRDTIQNPFSIRSLDKIVSR